MAFDPEKEEEFVRTVRRHLEPIRQTWLMFAEQLGGTDSINAIINGIARLWTRQLLMHGSATVSVARRIYHVTQVGRASEIALLGESDIPGEVDFWTTPLGQLVFIADGFPDRDATRREAAAVLGMSRQGVEYALRQGQLVSDGLTGVSRAGLYDYWKWRRQRAALDAEMQWRGELFDAIESEPGI